MPVVGADGLGSGVVREADAAEPGGVEVGCWHGGGVEDYVVMVGKRIVGS